MTKADLVDIVAGKTGLTKRDVAQVVEALLEAIKASLATHKHIEIREFGTFKVKRRKASMKYNPRDRSQKVVVPAEDGTGVQTEQVPEGESQLERAGGCVCRTPGPWVRNRKLRGGKCLVSRRSDVRRWRSTSSRRGAGKIVTRRRTARQGRSPVPKRSLDVGKVIRLVNHGPTVLASCRHAGRSNLITLAWATPVSIDPPMIGIAVAPARFSHDLIARSGEFVVNVPGSALLQAVWYCGTRVRARL